MCEKLHGMAVGLSQLPSTKGGKPLQIPGNLSVANTMLLLTISSLTWILASQCEQFFLLPSFLCLVVGELTGGFPPASLSPQAAQT